MALDLPPTSGPARDAAILAYVTGGGAELTWATLNLGRLQLQVTADAVKVQGVRINASATVQQQIADALGCLLPTPKIFDAMWLARAATLTPAILPISSTTAAMIQASAMIDAQLAALGNPPGIVVQQKTWCLSNVLVTHAGKAANYGFYVIPNQPGFKWNGIGTDPTSSFPQQPQKGRVIQSVGTAHDPSHVDYCMAPETRVLTADLRWVRIDSVKVGDELVGFDEALAEQAHGVCGCKLRRSVVQSVTHLAQPCYEVRTTKATVIASALHRWPVRGAAVRLQNRKKGWSPGRKLTMGWRETRHLKVGDMIPHLCEPWEQDTSWDGAWMAGFLDGEGWVSGPSFGVGQNPGPLLDRAIRLFKERGFDFSLQPNKAGCIRIYIKGKRAALRAVGMFRPIRLLAKSAQLWEGRRAFGGGKFTVDDLSAEVTSIREIGPQPVVGIQTSTGTFIAEGLFSHNSQCVWLVQRRCVLDGQPVDLAEVLQDPTLSALVSSEGPLKVLRQPGVPVYACPIAAGSSTTPPSAPAGLCPLPGVQVLPVAASGAGGGTVVLVVGAALAVAVGLYVVLRQRQRNG